MNVTRETLAGAVHRLGVTDRGCNAMRRLLEWLDDDGLGLDSRSQDDVLVLLAGAWGAFAGTTRDLIRSAIADHCEHGVVEGEYCEDCTKAYKEACREAGHE